MPTILAINPGSTSTKIGIFENTQEIFTKTIRHSTEELSIYSKLNDQLPYRFNMIKSALDEINLAPTNFTAIVARGGLLKPMLSGTYLVNDLMLKHLSEGIFGLHASNLGAILAAKFAQEANCQAFIVDPVVVDELSDIARISGHPNLPRKSIFHALNQKAVAKRFAKSIHKPYNELNIIVAHLGGGISVGCHHKGQVVEVNNALDGEGPFSPERAGTLPAGQFSDFLVENAMDKLQKTSFLAGRGGLVAHLNTNDAREVEARISQNDTHAKMVYDAMIYQVARSIAAASIPACGKIDYIILTGGIAYSKYLTQTITEYVTFIAPVVIMPGEDELQALAEGAYRILTNEEKPQIY